jgi:phosphocarrier protein HPr
MRTEGVFEVVNQRGLHARAASKLVQLASSFACDIEVSRDGQAANAKSVMGVLLLCGSMGTQLRFVADGSDAAAAIQAIGALIESKFGEEA